MPDLEPETYAAIDEIIDNKHPNSEWDDDEMFRALVETAKGTNQEEVVEDRGFSQPVLSEKWNEVKERRSEIRTRTQGGAGPFRSPENEAAEMFKEWVGELSEKYDLGINTVVVEMICDEIRDTGELPGPMYLKQFLDGTSSGIGKESELNYVMRRYQNWLESSEVTNLGGEGLPPSMNQGQHSGPSGQQSPPGQTGGIPVGGQQQQQQPQGQQRQGGNDRIEQLEQQVNRLTEVVSEAVDDGGGQGMVEIDQGDGMTARVPLDHPMAMQMMQQDSGGDFFEKLSKAKDAGMIAGPEHLQQLNEGDDMVDHLKEARDIGLIDDGSGDEEMAQAISSAIQQLGEQQVQAQQQMSQNFASAIEDLKELQEEDEDLSLDDVEEVIEEKMTKSEIEQVREEVDKKFTRVMDEVKSRNQTPQGLPDDPDVLQTQREYDLREQQLESVSDNLRFITENLQDTLRSGVVPALRTLDFDSSDDGPDLWEPPEARQGQPHGQPAQQPTQQPHREPQQQPHREPQQQPRRGPAQQPTQQPQQQPPAETANGQGRGDAPQGVGPDEVEATREALNLTDDEDTEEVNA